MLVAVFVFLALLVTLAGSILALPILWRASVEQWRRIPADRRPRAVAAGAATVGGLALAGALAIVAPWGPQTGVYVLLVGFGGLVLAILVLVSIGAVQESRRATHRHQLRPSAENPRSTGVQRPSGRRGE